MANRWRAGVGALALLALGGCAANQSATTTGGAGLQTGDAGRAPVDVADVARGDGDRIEGTRLLDAPGDISIEILSFDAIDGWAADDHGAALASFKRSCERIRGLDRTTVLGGLAGSISDWRPSCDAADTVNGATARAFFELAFTPVRIEPGSEAKFTAYYEPELDARRTPGGEFTVPLHRKPPELEARNGAWGSVVNGQFRSPFLSRGEIYDGALDGRGLEIAYLNDFVDAFFLQVQGSGKLRFPDGSTIRIGYAGKTGHPYRSVGREMIRRGLTTANAASAQTIQNYVRANPVAGRELLSHNQSYVFFRQIDGLDPNAGPVGALGVQLTDGRSIAVDRVYTPLGAPVWIDTTSPVGPVRRLVVAQDTGSAIKGPNRVDIFWGSGEQAGDIAGRIKHGGSMVVLLPTATIERLASAGE